MESSCDTLTKRCSPHGSAPLFRLPPLQALKPINVAPVNSSHMSKNSAFIRFSDYASLLQSFHHPF